ncbi:hypothetical protein GE253_23040 [Niveispirillum sp. SYP-B3756]|uniref:hypothetical protein n=1 Tax=Niveispirillum sp. SYP-B3756 TaxID=2662178 RepID=UPI0012913EEE|nr:hypothetical protein [Niveispirillum sp. SYP-B3756]MQP68198.1 hypothetical protein [Niveispirillum sp. SYP-B3756]
MRKIFRSFAVMSGTLVVMVPGALAQVSDLDGLGRRLATQSSGLGVGLSAFFYIIGLLALLFFLMNLWKHAKERGDADAKSTIIALLVAVFSFGIPMTIGVGVGTIFGGTTNTIGPGSGAISIQTSK